MRSRPGSIIDAVEAVYAGIEDRRPHAWLASVLPHVVACRSEDLGGLAHTYCLAGPVAGWTVSEPIVLGPPEVATVLQESFGRAPPAVREHHYYQMGPTGTFSSATGSDLTTLPNYRARVKRFLVRDQIYLNCGNPDGFGIIVNINLAAAETLRPAEKRRLGMLSAHLAAAGRIVLGLAQRDDADAAAAILEADGRVAHVTPAHETRIATLREHAKRIDRARGAMRRTDPEGALASWEALVAGRYSLVDRFDSDGRRYVVAHVNEPGVHDPRGLSKTEAIVAGWAARGHSDKLIAYELGMASGTVSAHLARVFKKLGVRTRAEMVRQLRAPSDVTKLDLPNGADVLVFSAPATQLRAPELTENERAIAEDVGRGVRNADIARRRNVSERTVAKQLTRIYEKLGVTSRVELARRFV